MAGKRTPTRVHRVCGQNNGGVELAEEMNGERGRQAEGIENIAAGKKKKQKGAKGEGNNAGKRIPEADILLVR